MTEEQLKKRKISLMDIAVDKGSENRPETDPSQIHSVKSGRGPLSRGWILESEPVMCCYKLTTIEMKLGWISGSVESMLEKVLFSTNISDLL